MNRKKAFFIVPIITHYRVSFYEKIVRENPEYDWMILDGEKKVNDGRPSVNSGFNFPTKRFVERTKHIGPFTLKDYEGMYEYVVAENPAMVIMPTIVGTGTYRKIAAWCKARNKKVLLWSCLWEQEDVSRSKLKLFKDIAFKRFINNASHHIAYSSYAANKLVRYGIAPGKIKIAYNGLDIEGMEAYRISPEEAAQLKSSLGLADKKLMIYVGGLGKDKRVDLLVTALELFNREHPNNNLYTLVIGDGPEKANLEQSALENGIASSIRFMGRIVDGVDRYFQACDCYVLPGCGGLGINQALYWEKPCIVSHADGTEEDLVPDGETGFRFRIFDAHSLAAAISRFYLTDESELKVMGKRGSVMIKEKSNVDAMVQVFRASFQE